MYRIANCYLIEKWKPNAVRCCRKSLILLWVGASRNAFRHIWFYLWLQGVRDPCITCSLFTASCHIREGESVIVLRCLVAFSDSASWGVFIYLFFLLPSESWNHHRDLHPHLSLRKFEGSALMLCSRLWPNALSLYTRHWKQNLTPAPCHANTCTFRSLLPLDTVVVFFYLSLCKLTIW